MITSNGHPDKNGDKITIKFTRARMLGFFTLLFFILSALFASFSSADGHTATAIQVWCAFASLAAGIGSLFCCAAFLFTLCEDL